MPIMSIHYSRVLTGCMFASICISSVSFTNASFIGKQEGGIQKRVGARDNVITSLRMLEEFDRRKLLNLILVGSSSAAAAGVVGFPVPSEAFLFGASDSEKSKEPVRSIAKDIYGADIVAANYLASKPPGDRSMIQGLKSEPTYLLVDSNNQFEKYALNAECSHLGCVVPWSDFEKKFICPCHGSQYDSVGRVLRGPAPYPLALAHADVDAENGKIALTPWMEEDFRTNEKPWWN